MLIVVSPAKRLNFETIAPIKEFTQPAYLERSQMLIDRLKKCSASEISRLMKLSETLTKLNVTRYKSFKTPFNLQNAKQAIFAFQGDTYIGLDVNSLTKEDITYSQDHLRILSGLYGLLSPLDLIQPYRLEMGTKLDCDSNKNLYEFWKETLTGKLSELLKTEKILVNLASREYFSAIDFNSLAGDVITPVFKEQKGKDYKVIGIFAKKARGMMARYIIQNRLTKLSQLKKFTSGGYEYSSELSSKSELVFTRSEK